MKISFGSRKLARICDDGNKLRREFGERQAIKIQQRLAELSAATSMNDIPPAARCHPLTGKDNGYFAVHLVEPYRLIFKPDEESLPILVNGGLDLAKVKKILVKEIVNYH